MYTGPDIVSCGLKTRVGPNSLLAGVADVRLRRLQSVQNAAARLVSGACRHDHTRRSSRHFDWLPFCERVIFKTAMRRCEMRRRGLHDVAPRHLADLCVPAASADGRRQSRSAVSGAGSFRCPGLGHLYTDQLSFALQLAGQDRTGK